MAKNIEININTSSGYEVLYPKTLWNNVDGGKTYVDNQVSTLNSNINSSITTNNTNLYSWKLFKTINYNEFNTPNFSELNTDNKIASIYTLYNVFSSTEDVLIVANNLKYNLTYNGGGSGTTTISMMFFGCNYIWYNQYCVVPVYALQSISGTSSTGFSGSVTLNGPLNMMLLLSTINNGKICMLNNVFLIDSHGGNNTPYPIYTSDVTAPFIFYFYSNIRNYGTTYTFTSGSVSIYKRQSLFKM